MSKKYIKITLFILWIAIIAILLFVLQQKGISINRNTPEQIHNYIGTFGIIAPIIYIICYAARPIIFFPASILTIAGGLLFGWQAIIYVTIGANISAHISFLLGRYFGKEIVDKYAGSLLKQYNQKLEQEGFITVLLLRLIPIFPYELVNYVAGLSKIKFKDYFWGTLLGMIPGTAAFVLLGGSMTEPKLLIPTLFLFAILIFGGKWIKKKHQSIPH